MQLLTHLKNINIGRTYRYIDLLMLFLLILLLQTACGSNTPTSPQTTLSYSSSLHAGIVSLAASNNTVYLSDSTGSLAARRASDGQQLSMGSVQFYPEFANADGIIYFGTSDHPNTITAWRSSNGTDLWHYTSPNPILWYPRTANGRMYIRTTNNTLDVLRMSDGHILWRYTV